LTKFLNCGRQGVTLPSFISQSELEKTDHILFTVALNWLTWLNDIGNYICHQLFDTGCQLIRLLHFAFPLRLCQTLNLWGHKLLSPFTHGALIGKYFLCVLGFSFRVILVRKMFEFDFVWSFPFFGESKACRKIQFIEGYISLQYIFSLLF